MAASPTPLCIGVDVGTGSARAGVFDLHGRLLGSARAPLRTWHLPGGIVEQSSRDIWAACAQAVAGAVAQAGVTASQVTGIAFDATCSLVVAGNDGRQVTISPDGDPERDVIVWMDHRAVAEAARINATGAPLLRHVGGRVSPEMQTPKLLWLKHQLPGSYARAAHFFDLADWLSFRASGSPARSLCTVTCKWSYVRGEGGWNRDHFERIGLADLLADNAARIGNVIVAPGTPVGSGLRPEAARDLGLAPGIAVAASLIDAHAGAVGTLGSRRAEREAASSEQRLAYILGTSACVLASTTQPCFAPGVWGPYDSPLIEGLWLNEGGQSAAGAAIDVLLRSHPCHAEATALAQAAGLPLLSWLERRVMARVGSTSQAAWLAHRVHVLPEYLGNRSPDADPDARAMLAGLALEQDLASLEELYVAGLCGLGYGLASIVDSLRAQGAQFERAIISGGAAHSELARQLLADSTGLRVEVADTAEPVLLGSAMLAAVASGHYADLPAAMAGMSGASSISAPTPPDIAAFHAHKRSGYEAMQALDRQLRAQMAAIGDPGH